ncbi:MAG: tetratricopeptide repeat protein [Elusimicrobiota bacterium]
MTAALLIFSVLFRGFSQGPARAAWFSDADAKPLTVAADAYRAGQYQKIIRDLTPEALQNIPAKDAARAYLYLAQSYERTGHPAAALGIYQIAVKLYPNDSLLLASFALLLHGAGLEERARPLFQRVLRMDPGNPQSNLGLAQIEASLGFLRRGKIHYEKALKSMGKNAGVWSEYAETLWGLKDYAQAEKAAQKSLSLSPSTQGDAILAFIERSEGRLSDAIGTLSGACERDPGRTDLLMTRALWMTEAGRWDDALTADQDILNRFPKEPLALWIRGSIFIHAGKTSRARADLKQAAHERGESPFIAAVSKAMLQKLAAP